VNDAKKDVDEEKSLGAKIGISVLSSVVLGVGAWVGLNNPKLTALTVLGGLAFSFVLQK
jgi:hypothetical protein